MSTVSLFKCVIWDTGVPSGRHTFFAKENKQQKMESSVNMRQALMFSGDSKHCTLRKYEHTLLIGIKVANLKFVFITKLHLICIRTDLISILNYQQSELNGDLKNDCRFLKTFFFS